jgi:hypothetical protein
MVGAVVGIGLARWSEQLQVRAQGFNLQRMSASVKRVNIVHLVGLGVYPAISSARSTSDATTGRTRHPGP